MGVVNDRQECFRILGSGGRLHHKHDASEGPHPKLFAYLLEFHLKQTEDLPRMMIFIFFLCGGETREGRGKNFLHSGCNVRYSVIQLSLSDMDSGKSTLQLMFQ